MVPKYFDVAVSSDLFIKALRACLPIAPRKHTLPALRNVLLQARGGTITITATDLELYNQTSMQAGVVNRAFSITIPPSTVKDLLSTYDKRSQVYMTYDPQTMQLQIVNDTDNGVTIIKGIDAREFPPLRFDVEIIEPEPLAIPEPEVIELPVDGEDPIGAALRAIGCEVIDDPALVGAALIEAGFTVVEDPEHVQVESAIERQTFNLHGTPKKKANPASNGGLKSIDINALLGE